MGVCMHVGLCGKARTPVCRLVGMCTVMCVYEHNMYVFVCIYQFLDVFV